MKLTFNIFIAFILADLVALLVTIFSYSTPTEYVRVELPPIYQNYRFDNIFREEKKKPIEVKKIEPVFELKDVTLNGIYLSGKDSMIVLEDRNKKTFMLNLGEYYKGYRLYQVYPKKVVFKRDGNNYELYLGGKKTKTEEQKVKQVIQDVPLKVVKKEKIQHYIKNFADIWKNISIDPVFQGQQIKGYKITDIKKGSDFYNLGFRKNDVIIAVNGKDLYSDADAFYFYKHINEFDSLNITFLRDGEEKNIEFNIEGLKK
jgi:type II secretion system protein C